MMIPKKYESSARVYVNADTLLQPLLQGLAVDTDPTRQVEFLQRTLLSRPNLEQLVHLADLDTGTLDAAAKEARFQELAANIKLAQPSLGLFTISYSNPNGVTAKNVVQGMITIFSEAAAGTSRAEMTNAQKFLNDQIAKYETQLRAADKRRAEFRDKYRDILPDAANGGTRLDAAHTSIQQLQLDLSDAMAKREAVSRQLASVPQFLSIDQAATVIVNNGQTTGGGTQADLMQAEQTLDHLLLHDTEQHPDVVAARRLVASLKSRVEEGKKSPSSDSSHRATVSNPVYEQLKLRISDADSVIASIQLRLTAAREQEKSVKALVAQVPDVEMQAQNLDRDYDVLKKNYQELVARRESTQIAEAADTQADRIQFRVVDAPQVPLTPTSPNRPLLFSGVLAAGGGAGLALILLLMQLDRSFDSVSKLKVLGLPVLGSISVVTRLDTRRRHTVQIATTGASMLLLFIVYGVLVVVSLTGTGVI
jgi:polysaccharide chain length determinant protein (PEP-CTERM system associated)